MYRTEAATGSAIAKSTRVSMGKPVIQHFIHTADSRPIKQHTYWLPYAYWEEVKQELREMLGEEVIEPSQSDWMSPIVLIRKKDR